MDPLTPLQRLILHNLQHIGYELYAAKIGGEWLFVEGGTRVEAEVIEPLAKAGLIVGEKRANGDVNYTLTEEGRKYG